MKLRQFVGIQVSFQPTSKETFHQISKLHVTFARAMDFPARNGNILNLRSHPAINHLLTRPRGWDQQIRRAYTSRGYLASFESEISPRRASQLRLDCLDKETAQVQTVYLNCERGAIKTLTAEQQLSNDIFNFKSFWLSPFVGGSECEKKVLLTRYLIKKIINEILILIGLYLVK